MEVAPNIYPTQNIIDEDSFDMFKGMEKVPVVNTLEDIIKELRNTFESNNVNIEYVHALMSSYKTKPSEWRKYAKFDRYR